ncbi:DUF4124 domain-containing protein [Marinobacterium rhizophilum]|uniref:DUF4124 domain-containing protein n=1 Tax=Marinobacterium rhizophilum TaxID=420402 RepID=UPI000A00D92A|nr:DUF4124 domain-containing protein [Marinobacterium rhizophilum]
MAMVLWRLCVLSLVLSVCTAALAESVYRWRDEKGVLHFSDIPPKGIQAEQVNLSKISVVSMPKVEVPDEALSPECEEGPDGEQVCKEADRSSAAASGSDQPGAGQDAAAAPVVSGKQGAERKDTLETGLQEIKDYDKRKRIEEIEKEREIQRVRRLTPGERKPNDPDMDPVRRIPKTVNEKLREKNLGE